SHPLKFPFESRLAAILCGLSAALSLTTLGGARGHGGPMKRAHSNALAPPARGRNGWSRASAAATVMLALALGACAPGATGGAIDGGPQGDGGRPDLGHPVPPSNAFPSEGGGTVSAGGFELDFVIAGSVSAGTSVAPGGESVAVGGICGA